MADFVAEWTEVPIQEEEHHSSLRGKEDPECWVMYFDEAFSIEGAGAGMLLVSPIEDHLKYVISWLSPMRTPPTTLQNMKACLLASGLRQDWALHTW
jgi:hypothetical protein